MKVKHAMAPPYYLGEKFAFATLLEGGEIFLEASAGNVLESLLRRDNLVLEPLLNS